MQLTNSVGRDVKSLRRDASRVLSDLESLHKRLVHVGRDRGERLASLGGRMGEDLSERLSDRFQENIDAISDVVSRRLGRSSNDAGRYLKTARAQLRAKPHYFLIGALAAGFAFGVLPQFFKRA